MHLSRFFLTLPRAAFMVAVFAGTLAVVATTPAAGQYPHRSMNPALIDAPWEADWIAHPEAPGNEFGVFHFRRLLQLDTVPESFVVHVSADNRYRLFVNGTSVSHGPARGDLATWTFESVDLAPAMRPGSNVVAAVVWNFGDLRPVAQHSYRTAFIVQGDTEQAAVLNTGETTDQPQTPVDADDANDGAEDPALHRWVVARNPAYSPLPVRRSDVGGAYIVVGPGERVDGSSYPWGWATDGGGADWRPAVTVRRARQEWGTNYGDYSGWRLTPRAIPMPEETPQRLFRVARTTGSVMAGNRRSAVGGRGRLDAMAEPTGDTDIDDFTAGLATIVVPPNAHATVLLDNAVLTTAYPEYTFSGGRGASVTATYAEALFDAVGLKGHRDVIEGKDIRGNRDQFLPDGGDSRVFRPLWWRTYRYLQLDIETADDTLVVENVIGVFTAYPFREEASFSANDTSLNAIWQAGWRTARLCAGETYFDCPYYEQLQYAGDTRIQALISLYVSGDDRLARQALRAFDVSRIPEGLTQSRYPSHARQIIPPYSLAWVSMVHDYWMHRDDPEFVEGFLSGIRGVLDWYEERRDPDGLFAPMPFWNFVDWAFRRGVPPGGDDGQSAVIALQYVAALQDAAELSAAFGRADDAATFYSRASSLQEAVRRLCWNEERGLFADTPAQTTYSQHTNAMAVLTDTAPAAEHGALLRRVVGDLPSAGQVDGTGPRPEGRTDVDDEPELTHATYYFRFFLDRAMAKAGLAGAYIHRLGPWREMLAEGLTTFAEEPAPTRSDAHAWSASPNYDFLATVCGIAPGTPGFKSVKIEPAMGPLNEIHCRMPHPQGTIEVHLQREGERVIGSVTLPGRLTGDAHVNGATIRLAPGMNKVE